MFFQYEKALMVAERVRSSCSKQSSICYHAEEAAIKQQSLELVKAMQQYCRIESSAILYISESGNKYAPVFCWLFLPEIKELLFFNLTIIQENTETYSNANQNFGSVRYFTPDELFRILIPSAIGVKDTQYDSCNILNAM